MTAPSRTPGAGDDGPGAVAVQLHVGARVRAEGRPPAARDADGLVLGQIPSVSDHFEGGSRVCLTPICSNTCRWAPGRPHRSGCDGGVRPDPFRSRRRPRPCAARAPSTSAAPSGRGPSSTVVGRVVEVGLDVDVARSCRDRRRASPPSGRRIRLRRNRRPCRGRAGPGAPRASLPPGARLQLDDHPFAPVVGREELLQAREDELHRPAGGRASAATCASKWKSHFEPNPPPSSGTMTRT